MHRVIAGVAILALLLQFPTGLWAFQWCSMCAWDCPWSTFAHYYDPELWYCSCPQYAYCTPSAVCVGCYHGIMVQCIDSCQSYYQSTFDIECGCDYLLVKNSLRDPARGAKRAGRPAPVPLPACAVSSDAPGGRL